jgi:cytochrome c peroxidase
LRNLAKIWLQSQIAYRIPIGVSQPVVGFLVLNLTSTEPDFCLGIQDCIAKNPVESGRFGFQKQVERILNETSFRKICLLSLGIVLLLMPGLCFASPQGGLPGGGGGLPGQLLDDGDEPTLPDPPYDYVAYAVTNLPDHFTTPVEGQLPPVDNTPANNPITNPGAALGRVLFYDLRLSHNRTISCASCHQQELGFSDPRRLSSGADGIDSDRRSMGLSNSKYYRNGKFRWDEQAASLEAQTLLPIEHPKEMNLDLVTLVARLEETSFYPDLFNDAFGDSTITTDRISKALAQFTRSMVSYNSKFDSAYTAGQNNAPDFPAVFDQQELQGLRLFGGRPGPGRALHCFLCHQSVAHVGREASNTGLDLDTTADQGAGQGKFKTPSLRNIAVRGKFMHDGRFSSLAEVVDFYDLGVQDHPALDNILKDAEGSPMRLNLSQIEKDALIAFLETLTDTTLLTSPLFSSPFPIYLPEVDSVEIDEDTAQRSSVASITIRMDGVIDVESDAITVSQRSDANGPTGDSVQTSFTKSVIDGQTVVVVTFDSMTRNNAGVLQDGNYQLTIDSSKVFRDARPMAEDFVYGDTEDETFFTFYGDSDGDRDVDNVDLAKFLQTYRKVAGDMGFDFNFDYDADGDVDNVDVAKFLQRYRNTLSFN